MVLAGLGNPGPQYIQTRHNIGFRVIDFLTAELKASMPKEKFNGLVFTANMAGKKVLLVKPQTYMNESGRCLQELMQFYKLELSALTVIYDDIDLPEGKVRIRAKGGPGTHNGMRSIVSLLKSENFSRIRIGIGRPEMKQMDLADFVLGKFSSEAADTVHKAICLAGDAAMELMKNGCEAAMQKYNISG